MYELGLDVRKLVFGYTAKLEDNFCCVKAQKMIASQLRGEIPILVWIFHVDVNPDSCFHYT